MFVNRLMYPRCLRSGDLSVLCAILLSGIPRASSRQSDAFQIIPWILITHLSTRAFAHFSLQTRNGDCGQNVSVRRTRCASFDLRKARESAAEDSNHPAIIISVTVVHLPREVGRAKSTNLIRHFRFFRYETVVRVLSGRAIVFSPRSFRRCSVIKSRRGCG